MSDKSRLPLISMVQLFFKIKVLQGAVGFAADTLRVFGYGESMPLVANDSEQNKQSNRRVEVSLNCPEVE